MIVLAATCTTCSRGHVTNLILDPRQIEWDTAKEILEERGWEVSRDGQTHACPLCVADAAEELRAAEREAAEEDAYYEAERRGAAGEFVRAHKIAA